MYPSRVPEGYGPLAEASERFGLTTNAIRLAARRQRVAAVMVQNRIYVLLADVERMLEPVAYPRQNAA